MTIESPPSVSEVPPFTFASSYPFCLKLIIPECGSIYCPWEEFKTIALSKINLNCIQEPLRSTLSQISPPSQTSKDDDGALFASPVEIFIITLLSVCSSLLAVGFILYVNGYRISLHSSYDSEEKGLIEVGKQKPVNEV